MPTTTSRVVGHGHPRVTEAIARQSAAPEHEHALPARVGDRARRAADRDHAARAGLDTVHVRQLRAPRRTTSRGGSRTTATGEPRRAVHRLRLPRHHRGDRARCRPRRGGRHAGPSTSRRGSRRTACAASTSTRRASRPPSRDWRRAGTPPAAAILDGVLTSDGISTSTRPRRGAGPADARGRRAVDRRRGPGRPRPHRRRDVVVPAARDRARHRHARQADGQRPPGRRGHHPARDRRHGSPTRPCSSARSAATRSRPWRRLAVLDVLDDERVLERVVARRRCAASSRLREVVALLPRRSATSAASASRSASNRHRPRRRPAAADQGGPARARRPDRDLRSRTATSSRSARRSRSQTPTYRSSLMRWQRRWRRTPLVSLRSRRPGRRSESA